MTPPPSGAAEHAQVLRLTRDTPNTSAPDTPAAPHLRPAPDDQRRRRARIAVWAATAVTVASLFALVAFHAMAVQQAFELDRLADEQASEARRYERLRAEVAERSSPAAIVEAALAAGMVFPSEPVSLIEAAPAAPRTSPDAQTADTLTEAHDEVKSSLGP